MNLRAIVFDFDGVIADTEPLHLRAFRDVLANRGLDLSERDYYDRYLGFDDAGVFRALSAERHLDLRETDIEALVSDKAARIEELERGVSVLFPGAADVIRLAARSVPLAIASGALGVEIRRILDREDLTRCFAAIIAADDVSASKPDPETYTRAVEAIAARHGPLDPKHCVAIEDSIWGLESARRAGLRTVAVAHTYGASHLEDADLVVSSLHDLALDQLDGLCRD